MNKDLVCPKCGISDSFQIITGNTKNLYPPIRCKHCNWEGYGDNILNIKEWKNIKRTELIDKMLQ